MKDEMQINDSDFHAHLTARMEQRGITRLEIERTLNEGWVAGDAKPGVLGKMFVFNYQAIWEGKFYEEKEVVVYFKPLNDRVILLTAKARYGKNFPRKAR